MSPLQDALHALGPVNFASEVPTSDDELDQYLRRIFDDAHLVLDTIPIADPDGSLPGRARAHTVAAASASEMSASTARSAPPAPDRIALQKDWGKPMKLSQKENTLGMSVYKTSGKDGKGAWFARRSVHEGLGFDRFLKAFEAEFPTSLAVQGAPGEGNVRGIGAETKHVDTTTANHARMQVYRLSAQFPGPTTPRDFVTLLLTSSKALKPQKDGDLVPRHFMVVSKPCDHPETQPRSGFIRGQYESVEFIREIPRKLQASTSTTDLPHHGLKDDHSMEKDVLVQNAEKQGSLHPGRDGSRSREPSPMARKRSHTVDVPEGHHSGHHSSEYDPNANPVEWIMVTRSDPGGSVPRFMVERGTPASICADAVKFLDWACQLEDSAAEDTPATPQRPPAAFRRESHTSFAHAHERELHQVKEEEEPAHAPVTTVTEATPQTAHPSHASAGIFASVADAVYPYAPHAVQQYLPHTEAAAAEDANGVKAVDTHDDDASSTISSLSWASADSHLSSELVAGSPSASLTSSQSNKAQTPQEKELAKLSARRAALEQKHAATVAKISSANSSTAAKEEAALKKAEEKHAREMKKQEERYNKEVEKLRVQKEKEEKKIEARKKRQVEKDEKELLKQERDEFKEKIRMLEKERDLFKKQVGELQKENTALMAKMGRLEGLRGSNTDLSRKDSDANKSTGSLSRSATPTAASPVASNTTSEHHSSPRPALSEVHRTTSDDSLHRKRHNSGSSHGMENFGNKMKHAFGIDNSPHRHRTGSGSHAKKKDDDGAVTPTPERISASPERMASAGQ